MVSPYIEKLARHFDGVFVHTHALGRHLIPSFSRVKGLCLLELTQDPNQPCPIGMLEQLIEDANGFPLQIRGAPEEIRASLKIAKKGRVIFSAQTKNLEEARDLIDMVRNI